MNWHEIAMIAAAAAFAQLAMHWMPWKLLLGRELPRPAAYILGTLGIVGPLTIMLLSWSLSWVVGAVWAAVIASGLAVIAAYLLDAWLHDRQARRECEEREKAMLEDGKL